MPWLKMLLECGQPQFDLQPLQLLSHRFSSSDWTVPQVVEKVWMDIAREMS
jgi:hypothetical protein